MRGSRKKLDRSHAVTIAVALVLALAGGNLVAAVVTTIGTPDTTTLTQSYANYDLVRPSYKASDELQETVDESYEAQNDIRFYPSYKPFRPQAVGCDLDDPGYRSNPLCKRISEEERIARQTLKEYLNNPAYRCADGRNANLGWNELYKLSPCPNGALRLRLSGGKLRTAHTTDRVRIHSGSMPNANEFNSREHSWDFRLDGPYKEDGKTGNYYAVHCKASQDITPYKTFIRKDEGDWDTVANLDDRDLESKAAYDIVITWTVAGRKTPAWLPFSNDVLKNLL
jgi:hypothetical protein